MFDRRNFVTFFVVALLFGAIFGGILLIGGEKPDNKAIAGLVIVYFLVNMFVSAGLILIMEADNEANSENFHSLKLISGGIIASVGIVLFALVVIPLGVHKAVQEIVPIVTKAPPAAPIIRVNADVVNALDGDGKPTGDWECNGNELQTEAFESIRIDANTLPKDAAGSPILGFIHVTVVQEVLKASSDGILVPLDRERGKGELWFQTKEGNQSWVAPF